MRGGRGAPDCASGSLSCERLWNQPVGGPSPINEASNRDAGKASLTAGGGVPYVAWAEFDATNSEIRVALLNAAGTDWTQPWFLVSPTAGRVSSDTQNAFSPSLAAVEGVPYNDGLD